MAFTRVPDPNLDSGKPGRSADMKRMRDNQDDFDARIQVLEDGNAQIGNHFNRAHGLTNRRILYNQTATALWEDFIFETLGTAVTGYVLEPALNTDDHWIELSATAGEEVNMWGMPWFYFNNMTKPITCIFRLESSILYDASPFNYNIGLGNLTIGSQAITDGVYVKLGSAASSEMVFETLRASATTTGTNFTGPAINTMFEVKIILDEGSNRADCYLDGVLEATLSGANLPIDKALHPMILMNPTGGENPIFKVDKVVAMAAGPVVDLI
jgi:hypothetical protein